MKMYSFVGFSPEMGHKTSLAVASSDLTCTIGMCVCVCVCVCVCRVLSLGRESFHGQAHCLPSS